MQGHTSSSWSADSPAESLSLGQMGDRQRDLESEEGCLFYGAHQKFQMVRLLVYRIKLILTPQLWQCNNNKI